MWCFIDFIVYLFFCRPLLKPTLYNYDFADVKCFRYKELVEQKQAASDELKSFERSHNEMKLDLHQKIEQLEKENFELKISLEDVHCRVDEDYDTLKDNYQRYLHNELSPNFDYFV